MNTSDLDVNTLFMVTMHVEIMLGLLLFFAWAQNFSKTALAWWGSAHLLRAVSIMLFGMHGSVPDWVSIDVANAVLFASFALTWSGARVFDRRSAEPVWCMVGVIIWMLACRLPQFAASMELRAMVGAMIVTTYTWLAAYEFWRGRDEALVSRWPAIFMLFAHGALFLLRTPLGAMLHVSPGNVLSPAAPGWSCSASKRCCSRSRSPSSCWRWRRSAPSTATAPRRAPMRSPASLNRRGFLEQSAASKRWAMDLRPTAVMLIDLDNFKTDQRPVRPRDRRPGAADFRRNRERSTSRPAGLVGRWGGDEFAAVIYDTAREDAKAAAERMQSAFQKAGRGHQRPAGQGNAVDRHGVQRRGAARSAGAAGAGRRGALSAPRSSAATGSRWPRRNGVDDRQRRSGAEPVPFRRSKSAA